MLQNKLTPDDDRMCPIYEKIIDGELCYETALCMLRFFKASSVPETKDINIDLEEARKICENCPHSDMS